MDVDEISIDLDPSLSLSVPIWKDCMALIDDECRLASSFALSAEVVLLGRFSRRSCNSLVV